MTGEEPTKNYTDEQKKEVSEIMRRYCHKVKAENAKHNVKKINPVSHTHKFCVTSNIKNL